MASSWRLGVVETGNVLNPYLTTRHPAWGQLLIARLLNGDGWLTNLYIRNPNSSGWALYFPADSPFLLSSYRLRPPGSTWVFPYGEAVEPDLRV